MRTFFKAAVPVVLAAGLVYVAGAMRFRQSFAEEVRGRFAVADQTPGPVVTEEMLAGLPEVVQRYMRYSNVVGKPMVKTVRLTQAGRIRQGPDRPWMPFTAEQYYTVSPPSFVWHAVAKMGGAPLVRVRDHYIAGEGQIQVTVLGLVPMGTSSGPEINQGSLMRYLNEMVWFPSSLLGDNIIWEGIDAESARVTLTDRGQSVSAVMYFDAQGRVTNFVAERYYDDPAGPHMETWATPTDHYGEFGGYRIGTGGRGIWELDAGDFTYIELEITDVQYDVPAP